MSLHLAPAFDGADYSAEHDGARLATQLDDIRELMLDGAWRTLSEISRWTGHPAASVSAQLRNMRKPAHGAWNVERRPRGERTHGLFEYRVSPSTGETPPRQRRAMERIRELETAAQRLREKIAELEAELRLARQRVREEAGR